MEACRHYWNTCLPLAGGALDRELLQHPLSELLGLVTSLMGGRGRKRKSVSGLTRGGKREEERVSEETHNCTFTQYSNGVTHMHLSSTGGKTTSDL